MTDSLRGKPGSHLVVCLLLAAATFGVYGRVVTFDFVNYDDPIYVTKNVHVLSGLTWRGLSWAFTATHATNWHPLTWLSLMVDAGIAGGSPSVYHLTNVLLHLANTVLLFRVLCRMTGFVGRSAFVAALFAVHPLHVESVAWVAERKDVLSTLFWLLTMLAYLGYVERRTLGRYLLVVLIFVLGLMSKPMLVTLPLILLLLDYWPLGRFRGRVAELVLEKVPLFLLSGVSAAVTFMAQKHGGAVNPLEGLPLGPRVANALVAYASYLRKMFWPRGLAVFYPHLHHTLPVWQPLAAALLLVALTALAIWLARSRPYLAFGWLWYVVTLVPVIGLVQVGGHSMADRYTYVPLIGLFVIIAWAGADLLLAGGARREGRALVAVGSSVAIVLLMGGVAYVQAGHWRDSIALFEHTIEVTESNAVAQRSLGTALDREGRLDEAVAHLREAIRIAPSNAEAHNNLASALLKQGNAEEAESHWQVALRLRPEYADAHASLAGALIQQGRIDKGVLHCHEALRAEPDHAGAHYNLGVVLLRQGNIAEAGVHFARAVRSDPGEGDARLNLGVVLAKQGKLDEAIAQFTEALRLDPDNEHARKNLERARTRRQADP